jgi:hypothetical protein
VRWFITRPLEWFDDGDTDDGEPNALGVEKLRWPITASRRESCIARILVSVKFRWFM